MNTVKLSDRSSRHCTCGGGGGCFFCEAGVNIGFFAENEGIGRETGAFMDGDVIRKNCETQLCLSPNCLRYSTSVWWLRSKEPRDWGCNAVDVTRSILNILQKIFIRALVKLVP